VRHLVLCSRSGGGEQLREELESKGARVRVVACDVSRREAVAELLAGIGEEHPLGAVIHTAGVLDDGVLEGLSGERIDRVFGAKVDAAAHLDELTRDKGLGAFVLFSSAAGVLGSPGQGNYAAANAFLDGLAQRRRARGEAGQSLAWGYWEERSGLTERLSAADEARMKRGGIKALKTEEGMALLDAAVSTDEALLVPIRFDLRVLRDRHQNLPRMLEEVAPAPRERGRTGSELKQRLAHLPAAEREPAIHSYLQTALAKALAVSESDISANPNLLELGLDSLMIVELTNDLKRDLELALFPWEVYERPFVNLLAEYIAGKLDGTQDAASEATPQPAELPELAAKNGSARVSVISQSNGKMPEEEQRSPHVPAKWVESFWDVRGLRLCVCEWGPGDGPTVVCLHGILSQAGMWSPVASNLAAQGYRVLAPDLRGHGRSQHPLQAGSYHLVDFVADLKELAARISPGPFTLVGHSMGAAIAAAYAAIQPDRVHSLVLVELSLEALSGKRPPVELLNLQLNYLSSPPAHSVFPDLESAANSLRNSEPALSEPFALRLAERSLEACENGLRWRWDPLLRSHYIVDLAPERVRYLLPQISVPTVLVRGTKSELTSSGEGASQVLAIPNAREIVAPSGHNLPIESPGQLTAVIGEAASAASSHLKAAKAGPL